MRGIRNNKIVRGSRLTIIQQEAPPPVDGGANTKDISVIERINNSAMTLQIGHIVVIDKTQVNSVTTIASSYSELAQGIVVQGGGIGELVKIKIAHEVDVLVGTEAVEIGDFIYTSTTPGIAKAYSSSYSGAIARALESKVYGSQGLIKCLMYAPFDVF